MGFPVHFISGNSGLGIRKILGGAYPDSIQDERKSNAPGTTLKASCVHHFSPPLPPPPSSIPNHTHVPRSLIKEHFCSHQFDFGITLCNVHNTAFLEVTLEFIVFRKRQRNVSYHKTPRPQALLLGRARCTWSQCGTVAEKFRLLSVMPPPPCFQLLMTNCNGVWGLRRLCPLMRYHHFPFSFVSSKGGWYSP